MIYLIVKSVDKDYDGKSFEITSIEHISEFREGCILCMGDLNECILYAIKHELYIDKITKENNFDGKLIKENSDN